MSRSVRLHIAEGAEGRGHKCHHRASQPRHTSQTMTCSRRKQRDYCDHSTQRRHTYLLTNHSHSHSHSHSHGRPLNHSLTRPTNQHSLTHSTTHTASAVVIGFPPILHATLRYLRHSLISVAEALLTASTSAVHDSRSLSSRQISASLADSSSAMASNLRRLSVRTAASLRTNRQHTKNSLSRHRLTYR